MKLMYGFMFVEKALSQQKIPNLPQLQVNVQVKSERSV